MSGAGGPLSGVRVLELASIGPGPFAAMVLADQGADVVRIDRPGVPDGAGARADFFGRGRRSVVLDLKSADDQATLLQLIERADILLEGYRPGVAERLGFGPDVCAELNPRLVFGRMTGWGQDGPLSAEPGRDINYIGLSGALFHIGRAGAPPTAPLTLVGDMTGGLLLAFGVLAALTHARATGFGQVVDAAMVDAAGLSMTMFHEFAANGEWKMTRGANLLDTGAPFYDSYRCADGEFVSVGALAPASFTALLRLVGLPEDGFHPQDEGCWPQLRAELADRFATRTRDEWAAAAVGSDACVGPVLSMHEAAEHEHAVARGSFVVVDGYRQPAPAPRFSRTPAGVPGVAPAAGQQQQEVFAEWLGSGA